MVSKPTMVERYELQIKDNNAIGHPLWEIQEVFTRRTQATNQRDRLVMTKPHWSLRIVRVISICEVLP